jgi:hypothetical protein
MADILFSTTDYRGSWLFVAVLAMVTSEKKLDFPTFLLPTIPAK